MIHRGFFIEALLGTFSFFLLEIIQCYGSVTFWYGSGSGRPKNMDPDPEPEHWYIDIILPFKDKKS
jgi:hypothetical protein